METNENLIKNTEKISKARIQLIQNQPFFACLAMRMKYVPADIKTCSTDGTCIRYSPAFVDRITVDELQGVIAHEVMHLALLHHTRRNGRDPGKWNVAADYAINPLLTEAKLTLPADALQNERYKGMSAEQIYTLLPDDDPGGKDPHGVDTPGIGDFRDPPPQENIQQMEADIKQAVSMARMMARKAGSMGAGTERAIRKALKPKVDWREALARFVTDIVPNDYCWSRPSTRYLHHGLILPSLRTTEPGEIILMVDTSASIDARMLNSVAAEASEMADTWQIDLAVIYIDTQVRRIQHIERGEPVRLNPRGGGGTDFKPGFEYVEANDLRPKAVVYLTDGACSRFPPPPDYPVLWTLFNDTDFDPPFGEVIAID